MELVSEDPWGGHTPWLRRRGPRVVLALLAAGSFLALTLLSTCSTRTGPPPETTTTVQLAAGEAR
ncbi:MAG TPA: hypothetical protein VLS92_04305 [Acidimicrobiia bacterium]|nr:hypothetical protein [Acidimicrobiia bacterium]